MRIILHWLVSAAAITIAAFIIPGVHVGLGGALLGAVILGVLNVILKPVLLILTLPINILTLGLFTLVVNGLVIWLVSLIVPGFSIPGFGAAILFALVLTLINFIFSRARSVSPVQ